MFSWFETLQVFASLPIQTLYTICAVLFRETAGLKFPTREFSCCLSQILYNLKSLHLCASTSHPKISEINPCKSALSSSNEKCYKNYKLLLYYWTPCMYTHYYVIYNICIMHINSNKCICVISEKWNSCIWKW